MVLLAVCVGLLISGCGGPDDGVQTASDPPAILPTGWYLTGSGQDRCVARIDTVQAHGGAASLLIESESQRQDRFAAVAQIIDGHPYAGQRVRFRGTLRARNVDVGAMLWMRADSDTERGIAFDNMAQRAPSGNHGWVRYSIVLDIPESAATLRYGVILRGPGQVWLDDCSLEVVSQDVSTTAPRRNPFGPLDRRSQHVLEGPTNLDFEDYRR